MPLEALKTALPPIDFSVLNSDKLASEASGFVPHEARNTIRQEERKMLFIGIVLKGFDSGREDVEFLKTGFS